MKVAPEAHPSWEELAAFDLGQLSDVAWRVVADHLGGCEQCGRLFDTIPQDGFVRSLRASPPAPFGVQETPESAPSAVSLDLPRELLAHPRYRILEPLGTGGMAAVFKAEHLLMCRLVALKIIRHGLLDVPAARERFCREVKALARLTHPNIVAAFDAEQAGETLFLVMEHVEGESLDRVLHRCGKVPVGLAGNWIGQAAAGLQFAFEEGLVHRDLKPANLLLTPHGQIKILDFGLARLLGDTGPDSRQTPEGAMVGTPAYVAPEQARDPKNADIRSDLYSLGCTWYELLAGQPPFQGPSVLQQLLAHQDRSPLPIAHFRTDVPPEVDVTIMCLLAKDPADRFQTPMELLQVLMPVADLPATGRSVRRGLSRTAIAALALTLVLVLAMATAWLRLPPWPNASPGVEDRDENSVAIPNIEQAKGRSAREQAVTWLRANGTLPSLADDNDRLLETKLTKGRAFIIRLGPKLVQSGRPTLLAGRHHDFFCFELPAQPPGAGDHTTSLAVTAEQSQELRPDPPVTLSELQVDQNVILDGDRDVTGSVAYRTSTPLAGSLSLRLTFTLGSSTRTHYEVLEANELAGRGMLSFSFGPLYSDPNRWTGSSILFLDLCSLNDPSSKAKALVLSNSVAEFVQVQDPKAAAKPKDH